MHTGRGQGGTASWLPLSLLPALYGRHGMSELSGTHASLHVPYCVAAFCVQAPVALVALFDSKRVYISGSEGRRGRAGRRGGIQSGGTLKIISTV